MVFFLKGRFVYSFHQGEVVYAFQIYMFSVQKLHKLISYYFYTYIFYGNFVLGYGLERITPKYVYFNVC